MNAKHKPLRIGLIGCGWAGGMHVDGLQKLPGMFFLTACCDIDPARLQEFGAKHGISFRTTDYAAMCASREVDVVVIATPPSLHYAMILAALGAGKHVVCEKPLTNSLAQVDSIRDVQSRSVGRVMPIFQYRFGAGIAKVRHLISAGIAGKHYVSAIETAKWRGQEYYATAWRGKFATELGGVLLTQAIHSHDLLYWLVGPAAAVVSFKTTRVNPIEVEDCAVAALQMADGSLATLTATLGSVKEIIRLRLCFENVSFEKVAVYRDSQPADDPWEIVPRNEQIKAAIATALKDVPAGQSWFAGQYEAFYRALMNDGPLPVTLDDARASIELITALFESSETGAVVSLPIGPAHPRYHGWVPRESRAPARKAAALPS